MQLLDFQIFSERILKNEEKAREYLGKIKSSGNFLMTIIDQVLEEARIESGTAVLKNAGREFERNVLFCEYSI